MVGPPNNKKINFLAPPLVTPTPGRAGNNNLMDCICRNAKSQRFSLPPQNIYLHSSEIQNQSITLLVHTKPEFMSKCSQLPFPHTGEVHKIS